MSFSNEAIQIYQLLSRLELDYGFISLYEYQCRIQALYEMSGNKKEIQEMFPEIEFSGDEDTWENDWNIEIERTEEITTDNSKKVEDDKLHFTTKKSGVISKWKFIKGDPDFFPSIPHGHAIINRKLKLDSYLGYVYDTKKKSTMRAPVSRESRNFIIDLWNDDKFRLFAIDHINWYLNMYPNYLWRVSAGRIRILPKKRKK